MIHPLTRFFIVFSLCAIFATAIDFPGAPKTPKSDKLSKCGCGDSPTNLNNSTLQFRCAGGKMGCTKLKEQGWCMERWKANLLGYKYVEKDDDQSFYKRMKTYKEKKARQINIVKQERYRGIRGKVDDKESQDRIKRGRALRFGEEYLDSCSFCKYFFTGNSSYDPRTGLVPNSNMWRSVSWTEIMIGIFVLAGLLTLYSMWPQRVDRERR